MNEIDAKVYQEVYEIINLMPDDLIKKIPFEFRKTINEKREKNYTTGIKSIEDIEKRELKDETIIILGLIYRNFICLPEEAKILQKEDWERENKDKEQLYNPENIFKNRR